MLRKALIVIGLALMIWVDSIQLHLFGLSWQVAIPVASILVLPLLLALRFPVRTWQIMAMCLLGCVVVFGFVVGPGYNDVGWPWPALTMLGFAGVLFLVGREHHRAITVAVGLVTVLAVIIPAYLFAETSLTTAGFLGVMAVGLLAWGDSVGARTLAQRALAAERQRGAVLAERARIARELHDVVAHHISMIAVQAEAAPHRLDPLEPLSEETRRTFAIIRSASQDALTEMRRVLGLLRDGEVDAERAPQPGIADLGGLVEDAARAGITATLSVVGDPSQAPAGVGVSAYRVVQEALSNAARHAPGAAVQVTLRFRSDALVLSVADGGPSTPGMTVQRAAAGLGTGLGLLNMNERVSAVGGTFRAAPRGDGGFEVSAELPIPQREDRP